MSQVFSSLTALDYAFILQGVVLLANAFYTLFFPNAAVSPPSPLEGSPVGMVHCLR